MPKTWIRGVFAPPLLEPFSIWLVWDHFALAPTVSSVLPILIQALFIILCFDPGPRAVWEQTLHCNCGLLELRNSDLWMHLWLPALFTPHAACTVVSQYNSDAFHIYIWQPWFEFEVWLWVSWQNQPVVTAVDLLPAFFRTSKVKNKGPKDIMATEDMNGEVRFSAHLHYPNNLSRWS